MVQAAGSKRSWAETGATSRFLMLPLRAAADTAEVTLIMRRADVGEELEYCEVFELFDEIVDVAVGSGVGAVGESMPAAAVVDAPLDIEADATDAGEAALVVEPIYVAAPVRWTSLVCAFCISLLLAFTMVYAAMGPCDSPDSVVSKESSRR